MPAIDAEAAVYMSDTIIPEALKEELKAAAAPLEDVPAKHQDWHPGSDEKVLDLVHPSLFPLLYGRSRILKDGSVTLEDCEKFTGLGQVMPVQKTKTWKSRNSPDCPAGADDSASNSSSSSPRDSSGFPVR